MRCSGLVAVLCACGGASEPLLPPTGPVQQYVIRRERLPTTNSQALEFGVDLSGDRKADNWLGMTLSMVAGMGLHVSLEPDEHIARGDFIQLAQLQVAAPTDPSDSVAFSLSAGSDASPTPCADAGDYTCGRHLQGDASFVAEASPYAPLLGKERDREFRLGPGSLRVAFSLFGEVVTIDLHGARVRLPDILPDALVGVIGGGIRHEDVDALIIPPFVHTLERLIKSECPTRDVAGCGCPADSMARDWLGWFDLDRDCVISLDEITESSLVISLTLPDLVIDGEKMLSFGFRFEAVPATF